MSRDDEVMPATDWNQAVLAIPTSATADEAGVVLRLHPTTVRELAAQGEIPAGKVGTGAKAPWRFNKIALLTLLQVEFDPSAHRDTEWDRTVAAMAESLDTDQAAYLLRLRPTTVRGMARTGQIPASKLPVARSGWRFSKSALLRLAVPELKEQ